MNMSSDGTVYRADGTVVIFSLERFIKDIVEGDCCFVCGRNRAVVSFNDEHVIPDWILRGAGLYQATITLPNRTTFPYSQYKVPCCVPCNSEMGKVFEDPISEAAKGGFSKLNEFMKTLDGRVKLFTWLSLIFLKTHLKDLSLREHRDRRLASDQIADRYDWADLHHIHCVARSFLSGATLRPHVLGSFLLLPAKVAADFEKFDYGDLYYAQSMFLRFGDMALVAVLNDCGMSASVRMDASMGHPGILTKLRRPLSPMQVRELMADLAYTNMRITPRPVFSTLIDTPNERCTIEAEVPEEPYMSEGNKEAYGGMLHHACAHSLNALPEHDRANYDARLLEGNLSFLWTPEGEQFESDL